MDETGILTVEEPGIFLALKGQKRVSFVTTWQRGKTVTVICAMVVACSFMPAMFIYPQQTMTTLLENMALLVQSTYVPNVGGLMRNYS
jgi:hypothetical protein